MEWQPWHLAHLILLISLQSPALAVPSPRWRVVGRNATPAWGIKNLRFFSDVNCSAEVPARTRYEGCTAPRGTQSDGSALAGPLTKVPSHAALGADGWRSGRPCPAGQDFCYVGFLWQSNQVERSGTELGFSMDAGCYATPRFSRGRALLEQDVELQCIKLEQADDGDAVPAEELLVQYAKRSALQGKALLWFTVAIYSGLGGGELELRVPLSIAVPLGGNQTAPAVSVSPATVVMGVSAPTLEFTCSECSTRTVAFLARLCDEDRKHGFGTVLSGTIPTFTYTVDPTPLLGGEHFVLCLDLDGMGTDSPLVQTSVVVYASGVGSSSPTTLVHDACDTALVGTLANRIISDSGITASSYLSSSSNYGLGQMWRSRLDNTGSTTWCADPSDANPMMQWDLGLVRQVAQVQTMGGSDGSPGWVTQYRLSYSVDGSAWTTPNTVYTANVDATSVVAVTLQPPLIARFVRLWVVASSGSSACLRGDLLGCQVLYLTCDSSCSSVSSAYVGASCDTSLTTGVQVVSAGLNSASANLVFVSSNTFGFPIDAGGLSFATSYTICVDADGPGSLAFGDTMRTVIIMDFDPTAPPTLQARTGQVLSMQCAGCSANTDVALAEACSDQGGLSGTQTAVVAPVGTAPSLTATLDASGLTPGRHYALCIKLDRTDVSSGFHDSTQRVHISGILSTVFSNFATAPAQSITFQCPQGCSSASTAYLGTTCDHTDFTGAHASEPGLSTDAASVSHLVSSTYSASFDASSLTAGTYRICADLDGAGSEMAFGDTLVQLTAV